MGQSVDWSDICGMVDSLVEIPDYYRTRVGKIFEFRCQHYTGPGLAEDTTLKSDARFILCGVHTPIEPGYQETRTAMLSDWGKVIRDSTAASTWSGWSQVIFEVLLDSRICYYCFDFSMREYSQHSGGERLLALFEEIV